MSRLQSVFLRVDKVYGSLGVCADVSHYKILCIQKRLHGKLSRRNILFDRGFLALMRQRKIRQQHCHAAVPELRQIDLCCAPEETVEMHRTSTVNRDHCEKQDYV